MATWVAEKKINGFIVSIIKVDDKDYIIFDANYKHKIYIEDFISQNIELLKGEVYKYLIEKHNNSEKDLFLLPVSKLRNKSFKNEINKRIEIIEQDFHENILVKQEKILKSLDKLVDDINKLKESLVKIF